MPDTLLNDKLNLETARINWLELQSHFARGATVYVAPGVDLIETAHKMADDNAAALSQLKAEGKFGMVNDEQAQHFFDEKKDMWAVVIAPWVLVQPCEH